MKLKVSKRLVALTLAGVMFSLTGCGAEKENNEVAIENEYNEINYDKELFKEIGVSDYIIDSSDFTNIINKIKDNDLRFEKAEINGQKFIGVLNKNNEECGAIINKVKDVITATYRIDDIKNYDYVERNCTYEFNRDGKNVGSMITDNYFDTTTGTIYSITTADDNLFMQAVILKNEKNQELGISIGKTENNKNGLLIINNLELELEKKDYKKIKELMYKCGSENDFLNLPADVLKILDKYNINELENVAYQKVIKA